jgi:hypothetical protein
MKTTRNIEKTWAILVGFLISAVPTLADQSPIDTMIVGLRNLGFQLVLLWLLTLAVVYGILTHLKLPDSATARSAISIVVSFLVLIAAAGTQVAAFASTLSSYAIAVAFAFVILMIFFGILGFKIGDNNIFNQHPIFFAASVIMIAALLFVSAGGLNFFTAISLASPVIGIGVFLFVILATVWTLSKD